MKSERCLIKKISKNFVGYCIFPIVLMMALTFITGAYYERNVYYKLDSITLELGEKLPDDILNFMGIINTDSYLGIETNAPMDEDGHLNMIGKFSYYLVYIDDDHKFSKLTNVKAEITVVDTVNPVITEKEDRKFEYGSEISASDIFNCDDLSGCKMSLNEDIDTSKSGTYEVSVIAIDGADNMSRASSSIVIEEKPKPVINTYYSSSNYNQVNNQKNSALSEEEKTALRNQIADFAKQFVGNPYVYGGTSLTNGTDCSGFTMSVYANFGYSLPRIASEQGYAGIQVSENELLPGDLIIYYYDNGGAHAGIYVGNGMMVHAATSNQGIVLQPMFSGYRIYKRIIY